MEKKKDNLKKVLIAVITTDVVVTTATAIASAIKVRKHRAELNHKPEIKADINIPNPIIPNSFEFIEKVVVACSNHYGVAINIEKLNKAADDHSFDFWYHHQNLTVYSKDEHRLSIEIDRGSFADRLDIVIVEEYGDLPTTVRTEIVRTEHDKNKNIYCSRTDNHEDLSSALCTPEFRFLKEAFNFKLIPKVEYNN